jgi:hypothetical protein
VFEVRTLTEPRLSKSATPENTEPLKSANPPKTASLNSPSASFARRSGVTGVLGGEARCWFWRLDPWNFPPSRGQPISARPLRSMRGLSTSQTGGFRLSGIASVLSAGAGMSLGRTTSSAAIPASMR